MATSGKYILEIRINTCFWIFFKLSLFGQRVSQSADMYLVDGFPNLYTEFLLLCFRDRGFKMPFGATSFVCRTCVHGEILPVGYILVCTPFFFLFSTRSLLHPIGLSYLPTVGCPFPAHLFFVVLYLEPKAEQRVRKPDGRAIRTLQLVSVTK